MRTVAVRNIRRLCHPGDLRVVALSSDNEDGAFGELLATSLCVAVTPGDVVVADEDGVVFVERARAPEVARAAEECEAKEAGVRERLKRGELGLDIYKMREALERQCLVYLDSLDES